MYDFNNKNFILKDGIFDFNLKDTTALRVGKFYEGDPFPNYKINDNKHSIIQIGEKNQLLKEFKKFIGFNKSIIEIGSGTCQLANYLAIGTNKYAMSQHLSPL